jgi:arsenic resistance protein ArsH
MRKAYVSKVTDTSSNLDATCFKIPEQQSLAPTQFSTHPPRILMLYGSLRERSYSKLLTLEAARLLQAMGAEVKVFDPLDLPQPDAAPDTHPKVQEGAMVRRHGLVFARTSRCYDGHYEKSD